MNKKNQYVNFDKNTLTILQIIQDKEYGYLLEKILDTIIIIMIIIFFYFYNIKKNVFRLSNIIDYLVISISFLIFHNLIKNIGLNFNLLLILNLTNLILMTIIIIYKRVSKT